MQQFQVSSVVFCEMSWGSSNFERGEPRGRGAGRDGLRGRAQSSEGGYRGNRGASGGSSHVDTGRGTFSEERNSYHVRGRGRWRGDGGKRRREMGRDTGRGTRREKRRETRRERRMEWRQERRREQR